ncbi:MAG: GNAT family N-acetyltransferase [Chloroflexi bacterium]|nr:MAG: GNAT family N-acetyltransferase [Chloroflexota bacterium]
MQVFPAELPDLNACYHLNTGTTTDYVWQMQSRTTGHRTDIRFDRVRLPRPMQVSYPRSPDELLAHWEAGNCFLVARNLQDQVVGYIDAQPQPWQELLWVSNLAVDKPFRRQGFGTLLIKSARKWAMQHQLKKIMLEVQTKNFPAIAFAQKLGFQFCGYNEQFYTNGDITLHFYLTI